MDNFLSELSLASNELRHLERIKGQMSPRAWEEQKEMD